MTLPITRYARVGPADVAYQVVGDGPLDLVFCYGLGSHVELVWDEPLSADALKRLASFSRLIFFDRRGTGASDGVSNGAIPTWEDFTEDLSAVMDDAGSDQAAILAALDAGPIAMLFAAMHPERVRALILLNTSARYLVDVDYPIGLTEDELSASLEMMQSLWGTEEFVNIAMPSMAGNAAFAEQFLKNQRANATPRGAAAQLDHLLRQDARPALELIACPTLVLHVADSPLLPIAHGRYLAEHIPGARLVELDGADLGFTHSVDRGIDQVGEFLTGERPDDDADRVLSTVLFTDIVGSTELAARLGDQPWRDLLNAHDRALRDQLLRFRGQEIKTIGDGFLAAFDGPARAIRCADAVREEAGLLGLTIRCGLHTGECTRRGSDLAGLAVHIAARVGSLAGPGDVLVSGTAHDLVVGSGLEFEDRGVHELRGVPGMWRLFALAGA